MKPDSPASAPKVANKLITMWDAEFEHPWLHAAMYGAAIVLSLLLSHCAARAS